MKKYLSYEETKSILPKNLLEKLLIEKTYREIAKLYGANERIISRLAQETYHIPKNNRIIAEKKNENKIFNIEKTELEKLYVNQKMSANAIHKFIFDKFSFDLDRVTIIKLLKEYGIFEMISPTINQYDKRICVSDL